MHILKCPSAWIPVFLSLCMLGFIVAYLAVFGVPVATPEADEGIGAHLFQIWLVFEVMLVGFFAVTWLPKKPSQALCMLVVQIIAILAACAPVFLLHF